MFQSLLKVRKDRKNSIDRRYKYVSEKYRIVNISKSNESNKSIQNLTIGKYKDLKSSFLENKQYYTLILVLFWRVNETYVKIKAEWKYLYRAVDSEGNTVDFILSSKRDRKAAKRFFKKALSSNHNIIPKVITVISTF